MVHQAMVAAAVMVGLVVVTVQLQIHCQMPNVPELYPTVGPLVNPTPIVLTLVFAASMDALILVSMDHNVIDKNSMIFMIDLANFLY